MWLLHFLKSLLTKSLSKTFWEPVQIASAGSSTKSWSLKQKKQQLHRVGKADFPTFCYRSYIHSSQADHINPNFCSACILEFRLLEIRLAHLQLHRFHLKSLLNTAVIFAQIEFPDYRNLREMLNIAACNSATSSLNSPGWTLVLKNRQLWQFLRIYSICTKLFHFL